MLSALTGAILAALTVWNLRPVQDPGRVFRFSMQLASGDRFGDLNQSGFDISPDGFTVAYVANGQLHLRSTDAWQASPIPGTEGASRPFFSPDGRWLGFFQNDHLKRLEVTSQEILTVTSVDSTYGATWGANDTIVFVRQGGLGQVGTSGGESIPITELDPARGELVHRHPSFLPDGRSVLFEIDHAGPVGDVSEIAVLHLDTGEVDVLLDGGGSPRFIPTGHIVFAVNENFTTGPAGLRAVPFDVDTRRLTGEPVPLGVDVLLAEPSGFAGFAISENGTLISLPVDDADQALRRMVWVDRLGNQEMVPAPPRRYATPRLSPDGTRIAVVEQTQGGDVWIWDLGRQTLARLTQDPGLDDWPLWSPDGERLVFASGRSRAGLLWKAANGTGTAEPILAERVFPTAFTPDGEQLLVSSAGDIHLVSLDDAPVTRPLVANARTQSFGSLSPSGRWVAYQSNESGTTEVYVRPFPNIETDRVLVSSGGGMMPLWNPNGRELHFLTLEGRLMSVAVEIGDALVAGVPEPVWADGVDVRWSQGNVYRNYDIDLDGERFLSIQSEDYDENPAQARFQVVLNWSRDLLERVAVN